MYVSATQLNLLKFNLNKYNYQKKKLIINKQELQIVRYVLLRFFFFLLGMHLILQTEISMNI